VIDPRTSSLGSQNGVGPKWLRKGLKRLNLAMGMGASLAALGERGRRGQPPRLQSGSTGVEKLQKNEKRTQVIENMESLAETARPRVARSKATKQFGGHRRRTFSGLLRFARNDGF